MELTGKIIEVLELSEGKTPRGEWKKQTYVMEYESPSGSQFNPRFAFVMWNEKIDQYRLQKGMNVKVTFEVDAREYKGRWYNDFTATYIDVLPNDAQQPAVPAGMPTSSVDDVLDGGSTFGSGNVDLGGISAPSSADEDDLPF